MKSSENPVVRSILLCLYFVHILPAKSIPILNRVAFHSTHYWRQKHHNFELFLFSGYKCRSHALCMFEESMQIPLSMSGLPTTNVVICTIYLKSQIQLYHCPKWSLVSVYADEYIWFNAMHLQSRCCPAPYDKYCELHLLGM